jgi:predicted nucleic acid-binding protein
MIFTDLPAGAAAFVDANTFLYHFTRDPQLGAACAALLDRMENGDLSGFTSVPGLGEVAHRLMTLEAITLLQRPAAGIGNWLRTHPAEVSRLSLFRHAIEAVLQGKIQVLPVAPSVLAAAVVLSQQVGLLTNDALLVALMQANGPTNLASHDTDFDRVPGITRYAPA